MDILIKVYRNLQVESILIKDFQNLPVSPIKDFQLPRSVAPPIQSPPEIWPPVGPSRPIDPGFGQGRPPTDPGMDRPEGGHPSNAIAAFSRSS